MAPRAAADVKNPHSRCQFQHVDQEPDLLCRPLGEGVAEVGKARMLRNSLEFPTRDLDAPILGTGLREPDVTPATEGIPGAENEMFVSNRWGALNVEEQR